MPSISWARRSRRSRRSLAQRHLKDGMLVLYDVTSSYLEGRCCELARFGYSRDGRPDRPQIVFGLLCAAEGCPVAVEVFEGDIGDPKTLADADPQAEPALRAEAGGAGRRSRHDHQRRIDAELKPAGLDWITALRAPAIQALAAEGGPLQLSLFDERDMAEIASPDYPGRAADRLPQPRAGRRAGAQARRPDRGNREGSRQDPGGDDARPQPAPRRGQDRAQSRRRAGTAQGRQALPADHHRGNARLRRATTRRSPARRRSTASMSCAPRCRPRLLDAAQRSSPTRASPTSSAPSARSSRSTSTSAPSTIGWPAGCGRTSFSACSPITSIWHMRRKLAPMLFEDHDRPAAAASRASPVAHAQVSPAARAKARARKTDDGEPVHSFRTLLADLATLTRNTVRFGDNLPMIVLSRPTPIQQRAFDLLGVALAP